LVSFFSIIQIYKKPSKSLGMMLGSKLKLCALMCEVLQR
jgi:hypothetical protein